MKLSGNIPDNQIPMSNTLSNKMMINGNVPAAIMLNRIYSHLGGTDVVTVDPSRGGDGNAKIMEKFLNPDGFSNSVSDSLILNFGSRLTRVLAAGPISIRVGHDDRWSGSRVKLQAMT